MLLPVDRVRLPLCGSPLHTVLVLYTNVGPPLLNFILSTAGLSRVYQRWWLYRYAVDVPLHLLLHQTRLSGRTQ